MPISEIEKSICKIVAQRFVDHSEFTPRRIVLKEFRSAAPDALTTLVNLSILKTLSGNPEVYLPSTLTFEFCGDHELLSVARFSTQVVLQASRSLFEKELDRGDQREYSPADIEKEVVALGLQGQRVKIGLGLYLAEEFGIFPSIRKNPPALEVLGVRIGERILTMRDVESVWDQHIRQMAPNLYPELQGELSESVADSIDQCRFLNCADEGCGCEIAIGRECGSNISSHARDSRENGDGGTKARDRGSCSGTFR
jgi:hypothetical protein